MSEVKVLDGGINEANALRIADQIWSGLCMGYGGHSQVPNEAYGDAIVGQVQNNCHTFGQKAETIENFMLSIASLIEDKYHDQWWDGIVTAEFTAEFDEFKSSMKDAIETWVKWEVSKQMLSA